MSNKISTCMAPLMRLPVEVVQKLNPSQFFVMMTKVRMYRHHHKLPVITGNDGVVLAGLRVNDTTLAPSEAHALKNRLDAIKHRLNQVAWGHRLIANRELGLWFFTFDQMTFGLVIDNTLHGVRYYLRHVVSGSCYCVTEKITEQVLRKRVKACRGMKNDNLFEVKPTRPIRHNGRTLTEANIRDAVDAPADLVASAKKGVGPHPPPIMPEPTPPAGLVFDPAVVAQSFSADMRRELGTQLLTHFLKLFPEVARGHLGHPVTGRSHGFERAVPTTPYPPVSAESVRYSKPVPGLLNADPVKIVPGDCGTKAGVKVNAKTTDFKRFIGRYIMGPNGPIKVTERNLVRFSNGTHLLRSALTCNKLGNEVCAICAGNDPTVIKPNVKL